MAGQDTGSLLDYHYIIWAAVLLIAYKVVYVLYDIWFSPLSAIPGPWYAAISDVWLLFWSAQLLQCSTVHTLFERYGPIVRVGPRRVVFCNRDAMKSVYCVHKLHKSTFYKALLADNHDHSITSLTEVEHTMRRRTYASHYTLAHLARFQPDINDRVVNLIEVLESRPTQSVDTIHLLRHLLADIVRITVLGLRPVAVSNWAARGEDRVCAAVRDFSVWAILHSLAPSLLWDALKHVPHARFQEIYSSHDTMASFIRGRLQEVHNDAQLDGLCKEYDTPTPLMARMVQQRLSGPSDALSDQDIVSECIAHLVGGVETSATTFGFMLWELSRRPDLVRKLRTELDEVIPDRTTIPDQSVLTKQLYLNAFLNESFRMYAAVASVLERVVPTKDDPHSQDAFDIMGFQIPPGTIVGTQAWSMHRDPDVFPNPEFFDPERWLPFGGGGGNRGVGMHVHGDGGDTEDAERLTRMAQHLMPFGAGTRACPGRNQAQIMFRVTIAALVVNFDIVCDPRETNEETMALRDAFAVWPASGECRLSFSPRPAHH